MQALFLILQLFWTWHVTCILLNDLFAMYSSSVTPLTWSGLLRVNYVLCALFIHYLAEACGQLTIKLMCGSSTNRCHKIGTTKLYGMSLYAVAL